MDFLSKRTKVVATVGPSSSSKEMLLQLAASGVNVFRLNFSHGTHEDHAKVIANIREINSNFSYNLSILQDLQGPKIRIGQVENNGVEITPGQKLTITTREVIGTSDKVSTVYQGFTSDVQVGETILIDDGRIRLEVKEISGDEVVTEVIIGGLLKSRKGINLPDTSISESCLTAKDLEDLQFGIENDVNWIAISFVRSATDIDQLRSILDEANCNAQIIAKIERPEALIRIDKIIDATDAIMIARGDLGIETSFSEVPIVQKQIIKKCKKKAKPVIVATQMLESMVKNPMPTRAEVNDIASAVMDGVDAVMLSEESAAGQYPIESVQVMSQVIRSVEVSDAFPYDEQFNVTINDDCFYSRHIIQNAVVLAKDIQAKAIIVISETGFAAAHIARHRPDANIFVFTPHRKMVHSLSLIWGVRTFFLPKMPTVTSEFLSWMEKEMVHKNYLKKDDRYVFVGTLPPERIGSRMALIGVVGEEL
ncbi:pyruvate kinase [Halosquirtibacter xylanolyticus]|uniref:pyruvate kinase n=1 Tax=Halosquirtibacter xylanolyticus TaxID=3374599 RepID=UPI003747F011|nr:pyruvate kinase [Prolixibacteraceae bacterium]